MARYTIPIFFMPFTFSKQATAGKNRKRKMISSLNNTPVSKQSDESTNIQFLSLSKNIKKNKKLSKPKKTDGNIAGDAANHVTAC